MEGSEVLPVTRTQLRLWRMHKDVSLRDLGRGILYLILIAAVIDAVALAAFVLFFLLR